MVELAIITGIFNYIIFAIGLINGLNENILRVLGLCFIFVLLYLFYADFLFVDSTFAKKDLPVSYILAKDKQYPKNVILSNLIYENKMSGVELYLTGGIKK